MNKKLWMAGGIFVVSSVLLVTFGAIGFVGWRYLQKRSAYSEYAFRDESLQLPGNVKYATKNAKLVDEITKVITIAAGGTIYIGKSRISGLSKTKDKEVSEKISGWKTSAALESEPVYVAVDKNATYKEAVELLRILAENGIKKIGFVTGKKDDADDVPGFLEVRLSNKPAESVVPITPIDSGGPEIEIPVVTKNSNRRQTETMSRPDPLILVIKVTKEKQFSLNMEKLGTTGNAALLADKLSQIFKDRESSGVFKPGSAEIEKTVHIKADFLNTYDEVIRLIDTAKGAGAQPIIIQLRDLAES